MGIVFIVLAVCAIFIVDDVQGYHECIIPIYEGSISEENFVCERLRTFEFLVFKWNLKKAFLRGGPWLSYAFSTPDPFEIPETPGRCLCSGERKRIFGFWARRGRLCWIVPFEEYSFMKCDKKEGCHGEKSKCEPSGHTRRRVLVYCDKYFLTGGRREPDGFDPDSTDVRREEVNAMMQPNDDPENGDDEQPTSRKKRGGKGRDFFFWAFFELPQSCCCKLCDCFRTIN